MGSSIQMPVVGFFYLPIALCILFLITMHCGSPSTRSKFWLPLKIFIGYILFTTLLAVFVVYGGVSSNAAVLFFLVLQHLSPWPIFFWIVFLHLRSGDRK